MQPLGLVPQLREPPRIPLLGRGGFLNIGINLGLSLIGPEPIRFESRTVITLTENGVVGSESGSLSSARRVSDFNAEGCDFLPEGSRFLLLRREEEVRLRMG